MFKRHYQIVLFLLLSISSYQCKKCNKNYYVDFELVQFVPQNMEIDQDNLDSLITRETDVFPTDIFESQLSKNKTKKNRIISARLIELKMQVMDHAFRDTTGVYSNFKDLKDIYLDLRTPSGGTTQVAYRENIPDVKVKSIAMILEDKELAPYIKDDNFQMIIKYRKRRLMHHEMPFVITVRFKVTAEVY